MAKVEEEGIFFIKCFPRVLQYPHKYHLQCSILAEIWALTNPVTPGEFSCWYLSSGIASRGERAVNTAVLLCVHVIVMVDEAGKD